MSAKNRDHVWLLQERVAGPSCNCGQHSCLSDWKLVGVFATASEAKAKQKDLSKRYRDAGTRFQFSATWAAI